MSVAVKSDAGMAPPSRERVELILHQLDRLPTLPPIAARLLALATSDRSSLRDLVEVIEMDPALTAGILRLVRRTDLGVRHREVSVARAVSLLGFNAIRNAVLCTEFFDLFAPRESGGQDLRKQLWIHSIAAACASEWIAERMARIELCGDVFVCGLLHDIGKVALEYCLPKSYHRAVDRSQAARASICDSEHEVFGLDHTVAGKRLLTRWALPACVVEAAWLHHQDGDALPSFVDSPDSVKIVRLADALVHDLGFAAPGHHAFEDAARLADAMQLPREALEQLGPALASRMTPLLDALGLSSPDGELTRSLQLAHQQLRRICADLNAETNRLSARASRLDVIGRFIQAVAPQPTIGEVCSAAASAVRAVTEAEVALVYAINGEGMSAHVGWCDGQGGEQFNAVCLEELDGWAGHAARLSRPLVCYPSAGQESLWKKCFGWRPPEELWCLPIRAGGVEAGALTSCEERNVLRLTSSAGDWEIIAATIANALTSACGRQEAERAAEELLDLNRRLREAQSHLLRMRSIAMVSEMAAGAAHELNNPLAVISGRAQMELANTDDPDRRRAMEVVIAQTNKAAQIVLDLMNFAKPDPPSPILQPLARVLNAVYQHWQESAGDRAHRISVSGHAPDLTVYADAAQVVAAVNEVMANALDAADSAEGRVRINSPSRASDETVRIVIEDNGIGMTPEVLEHAVDPFYSNRPAGRGRGLGLSRAYRLTEINGGRLWLESRQNVGTTVTMELPAHAPNLSA